MKTGTELISEERVRQVAVEGYDSAHDDAHSQGELAMAACCYAGPHKIYEMIKTPRGVAFVDPWPFSPVEAERGYFDWDKRKQFAKGNIPLAHEDMSMEQRIELLIKAGALIAAEIDRLKRLEDRHAR